MMWKIFKRTIFIIFVISWMLTACENIYWLFSKSSLPFHLANSLSMMITLFYGLCVAICYAGLWEE